MLFTSIIETDVFKYFSEQIITRFQATLTAKKCKTDSSFGSCILISVFKALLCYMGIFSIY